MERQSGLSELSVISWVSAFQGCPLSGPGSTVYCSLAKEHPWGKHLTSLPKRGVGTVLTTKECPCHVLSTHCQQIPWSVGQTVMYNEATSLGSSRSDGTQQWMAKCLHEGGVATEHGLISLLRCKPTLQWSVPQCLVTSDMHSAWLPASQHSRTAVWLAMQSSLQSWCSFK